MIGKWDDPWVLAARLEAEARELDAGADEWQKLLDAGETRDPILKMQVTPEGVASLRRVAEGRREQAASWRRGKCPFLDLAAFVRAALPDCELTEPVAQGIERLTASGPHALNVTDLVPMALAALENS